MKRTRSLILAQSTAALFATAATAARVKPTIAALEKTYSKLPMRFEKNDGQSRSDVDFVARGSSYSVLLSFFNLCRHRFGRRGLRGDRSLCPLDAATSWNR